jgi:hypothetical protein
MRVPLGLSNRKNVAVVATLPRFSPIGVCIIQSGNRAYGSWSSPTADAPEGNPSLRFRNLVAKSPAIARVAAAQQPVDPVETQG